MSTSKTGKHGSAKCNFTTYDIFNNKKLEEMCPSSTSIDIPVVVRQEYPLVDISEDGYCSLQLETGDTKDDLTLPPSPHEELAAQIRADFAAGKQLLLTVLSAVGIEMIISCKEDI